MFGSASVDLSRYLTDVTVDGTSIVENGVANVPKATASTLGVAKVWNTYGVHMNGEGNLQIFGANSSEAKTGTHSYRPIVPSRQHESTFYGLAKASGDTTQSASSNAVGNYTDEAKASIQNMLGITDKYSPKEWIAESETELVTNAHNIGDLFYIGETLYKVIADLNAGDAINVGVNVEEVDVNNILIDYATKEDVENNVSIVEKSASGSIASFSDGADNIPLKSLIVNIDPVQDTSSGDPSPENICPISGWTGVNLTATGINILDVAQFVPLSRTTIDEVDGNTGKIAFTATTSYYGVRIRIPIRKFAGKKVAFSALWPTSPKRAEIRIFDADENLVLNFNASNDGAFTIPASAVTFQMTLSNSTTVNTQIAYEHLQLEVADSVSDFELFGRSIPISWQTEAGTVYGGKLDVLTGKLTVEKHYGDLSGASIHVQNDEYKLVKKSGFPYAKSVSGGVAISNVTNKFGNIPSSSYNSTKIQFPTTGTGTIYASMPIDFDVSAVTFCYELATSIEVQLTPNEVNSLLGANNIWADTGDTSIEYFSQVDEDLVDYIKANLNSYAKKDLLNDYVDDIQIDGTSIVENGIAEIPFATSNAGGVVKVDSSLGIKLNDTNKLLINRATTTQAKAGSDAARPIVPICQHESVFYGLTKAAGVDMASSSNAVGTYTDEAKTAIKQMLGIHDTIDSFVEEVSGTDITITGQPSYRYNCGELYSLTVTPPSSGTIDIRFTSGSTPTVLTLPSTVKMPEWWVEVETNTIYEMCITDGIYCGVMTWAI